MSLLQVSSSLVLVFSSLFLRTHVSLRDVPFLEVSTPFFYVTSFCPMWSQLVLVRLVWSCSGLCQSQRVSSWCSLVLPGLIREEDRKKEKLRKITLFETKSVTCNLLQNSSEGESSVPLGLDELEAGPYQD